MIAKSLAVKVISGSCGVGSGSILFAKVFENYRGKTCGLEHLSQLGEFHWSKRIREDNLP